MKKLRAARRGPQPLRGDAWGCTLAASPFFASVAPVRRWGLLERQWWLRTAAHFLRVGVALVENDAGAIPDLTLPPGRGVPLEEPPRRVVRVERSGRRWRYTGWRDRIMDALRVRGEAMSESDIRRAVGADRNLGGDLGRLYRSGELVRVEVPTRGTKRRYKYELRA